MKRIHSLAPDINTGRILFYRNQMRLLNEIKFYLHVSHDDGLDALEMAVRLFEEDTSKILGEIRNVQRFFLTTNLAIGTSREIPEDVN